MSTYDAGSISAELSISTAKAKADLDKIKAEVADLEKDHRIKISAVFESASLSKARKMFADLDNMLSRDAISRLRSSPQGSVLGALDALFSPHPLTGAPSAQQAASGGLLGRMVSDQGGGGGAGATGASGSSQGSSSSQNTVRDVLTGKQPGNVTTTDTISQKVTGTGPGNTETTDTVKEKVDQQSRDEVIQDSKDTGDKSGAGFAGTFGSRVDDMLRGFRSKMGSAGTGGGADMGKGLLGGIGPGILGMSAKFASVVGGAGSLLGTLPAIAGIAGLGIGVALIGGAVAAVIKGSPELTAQFKSIGTDASAVLKQAAAPLIPALHAALAQLPGMIRSVEPELAGLFKVIAPQIGGIVAGLGPIIRGLVAVMSAAAPAFGAFIGGIEKLVSNILPGLSAVIRATVPFVSQFGGILATLGKNLGGLFSAAAPAIGASMKILSALLGLIGGLLPVIMKLASAFAIALAPVFTAFAGAVKSLTPFLVTLGTIIAELAQAVLGDFASAFGALAALLTNIAPALNTLATALGSVFTQLENTGVFAEIGDALETLAGPLGSLITALVDGLAPALPTIVSLLGQMAGAVTQGAVDIIGGLATALTDIIHAAPPDVLKAIGVALAGIYVSVKALSLGKAAFAGLQAMVASLKGLLGMGSAKAAAAPEQMQAAGDTMAEAAAAMQRAADTMAGAAGKEGVAGDAAGAEGAGSGAAAGAGGAEAAGGTEAAEVAGGIGIAGAAAGLAIVLAPLAIGAVIAGVIKATSGNQLSPFVSSLLKASQDKFNTTGAGSVSPEQQMQQGMAQVTAAFAAQAKNAAAATGALTGYTNAVKANGVNSAQAATARAQLITDLENAGVNSVTALNDVQDYNEAIAQNGVNSAQAEGARQQLITDILATSKNAAQGQTDMNNLALAVENQGAQSSQAQGARAQLIKDLENAGADSQTATSLVNGLVTEISKLHGANITITMKGDGTYTITEVGNQSQGTAEALLPGGRRFTQATGGLISKGTTGTADDVPAWLSKGEYVMQASSVARYGTPMMDAINAGKYASGGAVDDGNLTPAYIAGMASTFQAQATAAMVASMKAAMKAAVAAAAAAAAKAATGTTKGSMSAATIAALWTSLGGPASAAANMARIAGAESGDDPSIVQKGEPPGLTGWGLYQITPTSGISQNGAFGNLLNASNNTRAAISLFRSSGYSPWSSDPVGASLSHAMGGLIGGPAAPWQQPGGPWPWMPWLSGQGGQGGLPALMQAMSGDAGGLGLTRADLGLPATIPTAGTADTSSDASASAAAPAAAAAPTAASASAAPSLNAAQKAAVSVLENLMAGLIWHNKLGEADQANALLGQLGVGKYNSQLSQIKFLDSLLAKAKTKAAKLSAAHLLATFGVHVPTPDLTAKGNAPAGAVITKMEALIKGNIKSNAISAADQANALLTGLGVGTFTSRLSQIGHLDSLLGAYRKAKNTGAITATETLLRQLGVQHFAQGGLIGEPVTGVGVSGQVYQFGESGPEWVTPASGGPGMPGAAGGDLTGELRALRSQMERLIATTASVPHGVTSGIGSALGGAAQSASFHRRYPRGGS